MPGMDAMQVGKKINLHNSCQHVFLITHMLAHILQATGSDSPRFCNTIIATSQHAGSREGHSQGETTHFMKVSKPRRCSSRTRRASTRWAMLAWGPTPRSISSPFSTNLPAGLCILPVSHEDQDTVQHHTSYYIVTRSKT